MSWWPLPVIDCTKLQCISTVQEKEIHIPNGIMLIHHYLGGVVLFTRCAAICSDFLLLFLRELNCKYRGCFVISSASFSGLWCLRCHRMEGSCVVSLWVTSV